MPKTTTIYISNRYTFHLNPASGNSIKNLPRSQEKHPYNFHRSRYWNCHRERQLPIAPMTMPNLCYTFTYGFMYCPWNLVLPFPYWIANLGQKCRHLKHTAHSFFTQTGILLRISIAWTGHFLAHRPHPTHCSST